MYIPAGAQPCHVSLNESSTMMISLSLVNSKVPCGWFGKEQPMVSHNTLIP
jgi:hypothetical protein